MTTRNSADQRRRLAPAAGGLLTFVGLVAVGGAAWAQTTYVSNMSKSSDSGTRLTRGVRWAQPFKTGTLSIGYRLQSVSVRFGTDDDDEDIGSGTLEATIRLSDSIGRPGMFALYTLTNPTSLSADGVNEFTAPADAILSPDTRYHVVFEYSSSSGPPWWTIATPGVDDGAAEGWEIPAISYSQLNEGSWVSSEFAHTLAVKGTKSLATPTLSLTPDTISEAGEESVVTASLDQTSTADTTVTVSVAAVAPAVSGDYTLSTNRVLLIPAGHTTSTGSVTIRAVNNDVDEPNKTVTVSATATNRQGITDHPASVTLTITDDDVQPTVTLLLAPDTIMENGGVSTVTASLDHPSSAATTVTVSAAPVAPAAANDYTLSSNLELTFPAGETDSTGVVTITGMDNSVFEEDKQVTVSATATNIQGVTDPQNVTLTIADNEVPPPELSISDVSVAEGDTGSAPLEFAVTLDRQASATVTVDWETADGTAEAGADYAEGSGSLTFNSGEDRKTVSVTVTGDTVDEPDETFTVTLSNPSGATLGDGTATGTIKDDDDPPTVTLVLTPPEVGEAGGLSTVTATLDRPSSAATTVTVSAAPVAPATANDYTLSSNLELTIAAESTTSAGVVTITAMNNDVDAPDKETAVSATATNAQGVTDPQNVTLTIKDDDDPPTVTLVLTPRAVGEAGGLSTVTATLDRLSSAATTVTVSAAPVAPATANDYTLSSNLELTIAAESTTSAGVVTITAMNNDVYEGSKTVTVSAAATNTRGIVEPQDVTLTIVEDDPALGLSIADASVDEGDSGAAALEFTVTVTPAATRTVTVNWETADGTATAGTDYTAGSGSLTFDSGEDSKTFTVAVTGDDVDEPNETFTVTLSNPSGTTIGDGTGTGTIRDDDEAPAVMLVLTPDTIGENGGTSAVTATLDRPSSEETTVTVSAVPVSPAVDTDFTLSGRQLTFPAGETASTGVVTITGVDNADEEPNRQVTVSATATNPQGITGPPDVTLTIRDDDALPALSIGDASATEGDSGSAMLDFTVILDGTATATVTVDWETADGTAEAGEDYTAGNGSLTFNPGEVSKTVSVTVAGDTVDEPDETFTVTLSNESGATLGDTTATGTITDDDEAPSVTLVLTPDTIGENGGVSAVTATLNRPSSEDTTMTVSAAPVAPAVETDFTLSGRQLTFPAGETASTGVVTITGVDNADNEPNKQVTVSATATNPQGVADPQDVTLTIGDDDLSLVTVAAETGTVTEGEDAVFVVTRARAAAALTVEVDVSERGGDMVPAALEGLQEVTFEAGAVTALFRVATDDDGVPEPDSQVTVAVSEGGGGYEVGQPRSATVTVADAGGVSVLVPGRRTGASALLRRHVERFSQLTSDLALRRLEARRGASGAAGDEESNEGDDRAAVVDAAGIARNGDTADHPPSFQWSRDAVAEAARSDEDQAAVGTAGIAEDPVEIASDSESADDPLRVFQRRGASKADAVGIATGAEATARAEATHDPLSPLRNRSVSVLDVGADRGWLTVNGDVAMNLPSIRVNHADSTTALQGARALPRTALQGNREAPVATVGIDGGGVAANGHVRMDLPLLFGARSISRLDVSVREDGAIRANGDVRVDLPLRSETGEASTLDVQFSEYGVEADGDVRVDLPLGWEGWSSLRYTELHHAADGSVWDVYAGADYLDESGRTVYGFLMGYEPGQVTSEGVRLEAEHVQFGLYGARRLTETLIVDGAVSWGHGEGELSLSGGPQAGGRAGPGPGLYTRNATVAASYDSRRLMMRSGLTGGFGWSGENWRIEPQVELLHMEEGLGAFTDDLGGAAPADELRLTRLGIGPRLTWNRENSATHAKLRINLDDQNLGASDTTEGKVSAALELRHRWQINDRSSLGLDAGYDGLGAGRFSSSSIGLTFASRF